MKNGSLALSTQCPPDGQSKQPRVRQYFRRVVTLRSTHARWRRRNRDGGSTLPGSSVRLNLFSLSSGSIRSQSLHACSGCDTHSLVHFIYAGVCPFVPTRNIRRAFCVWEFCTAGDVSLGVIHKTTQGGGGGAAHTCTQAPRRERGGPSPI